MVRATTEQLRLWAAKAEEMGITVNELLRRCCDRYCKVVRR
jgi:hypothetical protein